MSESLMEFGLSQQSGGANGLVTEGFCIGNPNTYCLQASTFALNCYLIECDSITGFVNQIWKNTGTVAVPVWTLQLPGNLISGLGATRTLLASESGSKILFDKADGIVVTLPAPVVGMTFEFFVSVSLTSNAYGIETDGEATFILGSLMSMIAGAADGSTTPFLSIGSGALDGISMNKTTTGGLIGTRIKLTAISTTQWVAEGVLVGSGTLVTPFTA